MKRWDIINVYIQRYGYKDYLEIGLDSGMCRDSIVAPNKTTVDPSELTNHPTHLMTSDEFFAQNKAKYDVAFIDGLHEAQQVYRDIINALRCLRRGGMVFCHDMLPNSKAVQAVPRRQAIWTGDCWKAWAKLKGSRKNLSMFIVESDWGVGVIKRGKQKIQPELDVPMDEMDWSFFCQHKKALNYISESEFKEANTMVAS